jgi:release factor glutamine methyltransferase
MKCERVYFFAHPEQNLREVEWIHFGRYLDERMRGKPTQYITHKQEFYGREFRVTRDVLIPRPETELLVEAVLKRISNTESAAGQEGRPKGLPHMCRRPFGLRGLAFEDADRLSTSGLELLTARLGRAIDVGTGSGAIAATLGAMGCDLSFEALQVARGNGAAPLVCCDLLSCFGDSVIDVVVSNPPYIPIADYHSLQREVRNFEPHLALFGGADGLEVYRRLIPEAWRVLKPGGLLALEMGVGQDAALRSMVADWEYVEILPDLAGIPRVLLAEKSV